MHDALKKKPVKRKIHRRRIGETLRRAFAEFLTFPSLVIAGFLLLAAGSYALDHLQSGALEPLRALFRGRIFRDAEATSDLLSTIGGSLITVTSITFSLLLLAVQQSAATLTPQVYDQFLRRRLNQIYFGFFVGLSLYTLIILATVHPSYNPVFGATFAFLLTIVALYLVILLLYTTIDQMRPAVIIETIHDHILLAREHNLALLQRTRRSAQSNAPFQGRIGATRHGFVVRFDLKALEAVAKDARGEIILRVCLGAFVSLGETLAEIRAGVQPDLETITGRVCKAICLEEQRDLETDPAYGIEQLTIIGWTSISTAKSNPSPGLLAIQSLRALLARWCAEQPAAAAEEAAAPKIPVVYQDNVFGQLLGALESLAIVTSESMQHQTMAEIVHTFAVIFDRLPPTEQARAEDIIRRFLSALGDQVLSAELNDRLSELVGALRAAQRDELAAEVRIARDELAKSVGRLGSRATRAHSAGIDS